MTNIQWTDETINPIVGCSRISEGCRNCYAETASNSGRLQQFQQYQKVAQWDGTVEFVESQLFKPLTWKKGKRIFICSMSDLFHENIPFSWIDRIFAVISVCEQHTFQILTKRPQRMKEYFEKKPYSRIKTQIKTLPLPIDQLCNTLEIVTEIELKKSYFKNVWLGVSCENQKMADLRIPILVNIPAEIRFISCEPLLENIDLNLEQYPLEIRPQWLIIGGESGTNARPCNINWLINLADQGKYTEEVFLFVKQLGSNLINNQGKRIKLKDKKGGKIEEFPEELKVREFPFEEIRISDFSSDNSAYDPDNIPY